MPDIRVATTAGDLRAVTVLHRAYLEWQKLRHRDHLRMIERYFGEQDFEAALALLPGPFAGPRARLLLATLGGQAAGTVALRDLGGGICEMKRMFVAPAFQGRGLGRALVDSLVAEARGIGYLAIRLDTGPLQHEAHRLYRSRGFVPIAPYGDHHPDLRRWLRFMEFELRPGGAAAETPRRLEDAH